LKTWRPRLRGASWRENSYVLYGPKTKVNEGAKLDKLPAIIGMAPGALWMAYWIIRRSHYPRARANFIKVFLWGCAATIPTLAIEQIAGAGIEHKSLAAAAATSFLVIGPVEELFKLMAAWIAIFRSRDFSEPMDGIIYAVTAALGFACVENVIYILKFGPASIMSRAAFATPAHMLFASMWGYYMGLARFELQGELKLLAKGLLLAAGFHGVYNFIIAIYPGKAMISLAPILLIMAWIALRRRRDLRLSRPVAGVEGTVAVACPNCGAFNAEEAAACLRCGFPFDDLGDELARYCAVCRARLSYGETCGRCDKDGDSVNVETSLSPSHN
jgi:RsiW-degrading membrane proteinase PrsW (M82 family)